MKKMSLGLALVLCGCGGNSLDGKWKGTVSGWEMTLEAQEVAESSGTTAFTGTASTNKPACFNNGALTGTLVKTSASLIATGSGSASSTTFLKVDGEVSGGTLTGFVEVIGDGECSVPRSAVTFTKQ
ncbi:MAG: hypothetical protein ABW123_11995 [Cystobacter sp.]